VRGRFWFAGNVHIHTGDSWGLFVVAADDHGPICRPLPSDRCRLSGQLVKILPRSSETSFNPAEERATMRRMPMWREGIGKGGGGRRDEPKNVLGDRIEVCSLRPMTGFFRDGCCDTSAEDIGSHTVCAVMTAGFLDFSKSRGNDLSTPVPEFGFAGLKPGDRWCLCAPRWSEALRAGHAPRVVLRASHEGTLTYCSLADLKHFAVDLD
jgi:uncharacterized protein (DUF2237 family)